MFCVVVAVKLVFYYMFCVFCIAVAMKLVFYCVFCVVVDIAMKKRSVEYKLVNPFFNFHSPCLPHQNGVSHLLHAQGLPIGSLSLSPLSHSQRNLACWRRCEARFKPGRPVVTDKTLCPSLCPLGSGGKFSYYQVFCLSGEGFHT